MTIAYIIVNRSGSKMFCTDCNSVLVKCDWCLKIKVCPESYCQFEHCSICSKNVCDNCIRECTNHFPDCNSLPICPCSSNECKRCKQTFCNECGFACAECDEIFCGKCGEGCEACQNYFCKTCLPRCRSTCRRCGHLQCLDCKYSYLNECSPWESKTRERLLLLERHMNPKRYDYDDAINLLLLNS